jgi:hypothetical protein
VGEALDATMARYLALSPINGKLMLYRLFGHGLTPNSPSIANAKNIRNSRV